MGPGLSHSLSPRGCADLTDVTLADDDTNPIQTDNANRAIQGNVAMQVTQTGGQLCKQSKWRHPMNKLCHLVAKYATNTGGAIWWPNLQQIQVTSSGGGQICY